MELPGELRAAVESAAADIPLRELTALAGGLSQRYREQSGTGRSLLHGEAVSLGLRGALYLSRKLGGLSREDEREVLDTLRALELPLVLPQEVDIDRALALTTADKKFAGGRIRFVLLHRCGVPYLADNVTQQDLQDAMKELTKPC